MGAGSSPNYLEAAYPLAGPIAAGTWGIVGDGILAGNQVQSMTMLFEARLRPAGISDDHADVVLCAVKNTFLRDSSKPFSAVPFSGSVAGVAAAAAPGDLLVYRVTALAGDPGAIYIWNGDGASAGGRIPRLDLPR